MLNLARAAAARQTSNPKTCRFLVDARHTSCRKLAKFDGPRQRLRHSLTVNTVRKLGPILYVTKNLDSENVRSSNDFDATGFRAQLHHHSLVRVRLSSRGIFGSISLSLSLARYLTLELFNLSEVRIEKRKGFHGEILSAMPQTVYLLAWKSCAQTEEHACRGAAGRMGNCVERTETHASLREDRCGQRKENPRCSRLALRSRPQVR